MWWWGIATAGRIGGGKKKRVGGLMWSHIEKYLAETKNELEGVG